MLEHTAPHEKRVGGRRDRDVVSGRTRNTRTARMGFLVIVAVSKRSPTLFVREGGPVKKENVGVVAVSVVPAVAASGITITIVDHVVFIGDTRDTTHVYGRSPTNGRSLLRCSTRVGN